MENFASILERDYGFKSGKNAPMVSGSGGGSSGGGGYAGLRKSVPATRMSANAGAYGQEDPFAIGRKNEGSKSGRSSYGSRDDLFSPAAYDDVFGGPPKSSDAGARYDDVFGGAPQGAPVFDDLLGGGFGGSTPKVKSASGSFHSSPRRSDRNHFVSSEPVYDELLPGFGFLPKSRASSEAKVSHEPDPFVPVSSDPLASSSAAGSSAATFDDDDGGLLPGFESAPKSRTFSGDAKSSRQPDPLLPIFDDPLPSGIPPASSSYTDDEGLLPGFSSEGPKSRSFREAKVAPVQDSFGSLGDDPISSSIPSGSPDYDDLLNVFNEPQVPPSSSSSRAPGNGVKADRFESFDRFPHSPGNSDFFKDSSRKSADDASRTTSRVGPGSPEAAASARQGIPSDDISEVFPDSDPFFPSQTESGKSAGGLESSEQLEEETPTWDFPTSDEPQIDRGSSGNSRSRDLKNAWLTVDDMKLLTQPSPVPPPSRRPPPLPGSGSGFREKAETRDAEFVTSSSSASPEEDVTGSNAAAPPSYEQAVPGWKDFKMQPSRDEEREREEREKREEARKERRRQEREEAKASREIREREIREREAKQAREQERLRREKEREKDRAAVRIATLEARERAAQEAREKAERSAVERVTGEARERAASQARARVERAAVERANAEARERAEVRAAVERAAAEARERAERASAEKAAVERAAGEVRERASRAVSEKAAVERAQSEVRERAARVAAEKAAVERAAAEARERTERAAAEKAAAARERSHQQRKSENDLESFFANSGPPASNDARQRPSSMNNNTNVFGDTRRTSSATATTTGSMDDWASIFGATPSSDDSQDIRRGGETGGRTTRARTERQQHTRERAAKAIAEINQRDLETQREQAEKQRAGDVLDAEIRRWAAGKEGNLRALLSTLQYVLWPECGWTPVSLTDLINPTSVKKTYRKATLYVHPDKVQQKGATVQQKYIAEKVFDLLKEASNKFNSEELF